MHGAFVNSVPLPEFSLWERMKNNRALASFDLELTGRCNNNCQHCYINLPVNDKKAKEKELVLAEIKSIIDQAVDLGALWCLITGGEPLLREDFFDIYLYLKKKGLLVSVFTNASLINDRHIRLFKKYPPRDIEVTVYGVTKETYEQVTRKAGSFDCFMRGLNLLLGNGIKVRFKAMALRSNVHELPEIAEFCRQRTKDFFRFDPFLHLRFDNDSKRNEEIKSERLSPEDIVGIEKSDSERFRALEKGCDKLIMPEFSHINCNHLFHCGAGNGSFTVSYDGYLRLCSSLWHPDCIYDLKKGSLKDAWENFVSRVRDMRSNNEEFLKKCRICPIINLCMWCPAHSHLETGELDKPVEYFCEVAHSRAEALGQSITSIK
jgi:radical SAM protein with 4Fe4S-binding SPASM domain